MRATNRERTYSTSNIHSCQYSQPIRKLCHNEPVRSQQQSDVDQQCIRGRHISEWCLVTFLRILPSTFQPRVHTCMWSQRHQELREWHTAGTRTLARERSYRPCTTRQPERDVEAQFQYQTRQHERPPPGRYLRQEMAHHYRHPTASMHRLWWAPVLKIQNNNQWSICWGKIFTQHFCYTFLFSMGRIIKSFAACVWSVCANMSKTALDRASVPMDHQ